MLHGFITVLYFATSYISNFRYFINIYIYMFDKSKLSRAYRWYFQYIRYIVFNVIIFNMYVINGSHITLL